MRKIFSALLVLMLCLMLCSSPSYSEVNPDPEVHRIIGGLYSLAAAVCLNGNTNPNVSNLVSFFKDIPSEWKNGIKVSRVNSSIWVGMSVNQYSTARHFLRANAEALGITESPEGYAWIGGDDAWIKAADISGSKIKPIRLKASKGSGNDSRMIFLSTEGQVSWWQMNPTPKSSMSEKIISRWGVKESSELHAPKGNKTSIYESVRPSAVRKKPADIHIGTRRNSFDMSMNVGDVVFTPVPQLRHDRTTVEEIDRDENEDSEINTKQ